MRHVIFLLALACGSVYGEDWAPPEQPDLQAILQEARADASAKRYEIALAKHVWLHNNALSIDPAFYGVRLSFALSYWHELAKEYPPAMTKLTEIRDQAKKNVLEGIDVHESFHDMESINDQLGAYSATKDVFESLDKENPESAKQVFSLAKPALVRTEAYKLFGKYAMPKSEYAKIISLYSQAIKHADDPRIGPDHLEFMNERFANDVTILVAILAVNGRGKEAGEIAASARTELADKDFHAGLEKALKGIVPEPWP